jgi:hypothetical protein
MEGGRSVPALDNADTAAFFTYGYQRPKGNGLVVKVTLGDSDSGAASADEAQVFHAISRKWTPLSHDIRRVEFRFGEDSDGSPAVWITVIVPADLKPSKEKIDNLYYATELFRKDILESDTNRWPYISIQTE